MKIIGIGNEECVKVDKHSVVDTLLVSLVLNSLFNSILMSLTPLSDK